MERMKIVDVARGILILYVVFVIHGLFWLKLAPRSISSLALFEMPAIFTLSGYSYWLYESSRKHAREDPHSRRFYLRFVASRLIRILLPYFVYATFCVVLIALVTPSKPDEAHSLTALILAWGNPFQYGMGMSLGMLNWHLWFIPIFLLVMAALPIVTRLQPFTNPNILAIVFGMTAIVFVMSRLHFWYEGTLKGTIFYLLFALFGYYLGQSRSYWKKVQFSTIAMIAGVALISIAFLRGDVRVLDMQANKFPPNYLFFLFSCFWMALFGVVTFSIPTMIGRLEKYHDLVWLRPFISSGYSIYMWQGVGYTMADLFGKWLDAPNVLVWILALGLSVGCGLLASPAERIRMNWQVLSKKDGM